MPRLFIIIGLKEKRGEPHLVYLGRDGTAMQAACAAAPYPLLEKFLNPHGIRKNNSAGETNAAAEDAAFQAETDLAQAEYNAAVRAKAEELVAPFREAAALANGFEADLAKLRAEIAGEREREQSERSKILAEFAGARKGLEAALAERDAENKSLREELKKAKKAAGAPPPPEPTGP